MVQLVRNNIIIKEKYLAARRFVLVKYMWENKKIIVWGMGKYFERNFSRIDPRIKIYKFCDSDKDKHGKCYTAKKIMCISPENIIKERDIFVILAIQSISAEAQITIFLRKNNIEYCHLNEIISAYQKTWENNELKKYDIAMKNVLEPPNKDRLKFFVSISVPTEVCNLKCSYCYISQHQGFSRKNVIFHSAEFISKALSRKRLGGTALINICGEGETLLCDDLPAIIVKLLQEGHYISIITNAVFTEKIKKIISSSGDNSERILFKCSFHYRELLKKKSMKKFINSINLIKNSKSSYSIELVPEDSLIPIIDEIKNFSIKEFGALPHLTVPRDEGKSGIPILSDLNFEEFYKVWKTFHSKMFDFKMKHIKKVRSYCLSGEKSILFSLESGELSPCPYNKCEGNLYDNISEILSLKPLAGNCQAPWCINSHAYLTIGLNREINDGSYLDMRDRITIDGEHWIKPQMANFIKQRICDEI